MALSLPCAPASQLLIVLLADSPRQVRLCFLIHLQDEGQLRCQTANHLLSGVHQAQLQSLSLHALLAADTGPFRRPPICCTYAKFKSSGYPNYPKQL